MARSTNPEGDCYCHLWDQDPEALRERGIPPGHCGLCSVEVKGGVPCGRPGHVRSGPGPFTTCTCDEHNGGSRPVHFGCLVLGALLVVAAACLLLWWFLVK